MRPFAFAAVMLLVHPFPLMVPFDRRVLRFHVARHAALSKKFRSWWACRTMNGLAPKSVHFSRGSQWYFPELRCASSMLRHWLRSGWAPKSRSWWAKSPSLRR